MFVVPFLKRMQVRQNHFGDLPELRHEHTNHTLKNSKGLNADLSRAPGSPSADWNSIRLPTLAEANDMSIRFALDHCGGNRDATARFLGIGACGSGPTSKTTIF